MNDLEYWRIYFILLNREYTYNLSWYSKLGSKMSIPQGIGLNCILYFIFNKSLTI